MALTMFGAIMAFAADMATRTGEHYSALSRQATDATLKENLEDLAREEGKNRTRIEETRRMNVTEIMLEPVAGLHEEAYQMEVTPASTDKEVLSLAVALEEREKRFFQDASAKVPLPEVGRFFRKIAEKKEKSLSRLGAIRVD